jgi:LAO/AO transport system kinase
VSTRLGDRVVAGDPRAIARAISLIEDEDPAGAELVRDIFPHTGRAYLVGVTGPPGAGKSTLVDRLVSAVRAQPRSRDARVGESRHRSADARPSRGGNAERAQNTETGTISDDAAVSHGTTLCGTVGVIAVDPTSPFSGGAVLGDRLRMQAHAGDADVFIRSMATRGHLGGLARATGDAALVLDAAGKDVIIIETVGVGQDEVDIIRTADVSIVTLVPGTGDEVQALKAGIMEIADIFVVNKADREGADRLVSAVEANLGLHTYGNGEWRPPIVKTVATSGTGVGELVEAVRRFRAHSAQTRAARRTSRSEYRLRELVAQRFMERLERGVLAEGELASIVGRIAAREIDPYTAANQLLERAGLKAHAGMNQR